MTQTLSPSLISLIQQYNLDISIVDIKNLGVGNRLDTDFYKPEHLATEKLTQSIHFCSFKDLGIQVDASAFYPSIEPKYNTGKLPFLRVANVDTNIKYDEAVTIPEELPSIYTTIKIGRPGDIVITKGGTVARCGILDRNCALSRDLILVPSSHLARIQQKALFIYLISNTSNKLLLKTASLTAQPHLTLKLIQEHPIFVPKGTFINKISEIFDEYTIQLELSKSLYAEAENILLSELGLVDWKPSVENIIEKMSEEVELFGRFDAEFFQPRYDEMIQRIRKFPCKTIAELSSVVGHPSNPTYSNNLNKKEKTYVLTQKHLGEFYPIDNFWEDEDALFTTDDFLMNNEKYILQQDDLILYSVGAYIGKTNIYNSPTQSIIGSFLTLIRPKKDLINSYYFMMFMNSWVGLELTRRNQRGLAQQYIYPYDIREQIVPILPNTIQTLISEKIIASHIARETSKKLLEKAKRAVEIFIEEDEDSANKYLG